MTWRKNEGGRTGKQGFWVEPNDRKSGNSARHGGRRGEGSNKEPVAAVKQEGRVGEKKVLDERTIQGNTKGKEQMVGRGPFTKGKKANPKREDPENLG